MLLHPDHLYWLIFKDLRILVALGEKKSVHIVQTGSVNLAMVSVCITETRNLQIRASPPPRQAVRNWPASDRVQWATVPTEDTHDQHGLGGWPRVSLCPGAAVSLLLRQRCTTARGKHRSPPLTSTKMQMNGLILLDIRLSENLLS